MEIVWILLAVAWTIISAVVSAAAAVFVQIYSTLDVVLPSGIALIAAIAGGSVVLVFPLALCGAIARAYREEQWLERIIGRFTRTHTAHRTTRTTERVWSEEKPTTDPPTRDEQWWPGNDDTEDDDDGWEEVFESLIEDDEARNLSATNPLRDELFATGEWHTLTADENASYSAKKKAFRRLCNRFHPDKCATKYAQEPHLLKAANACQAEILRQWRQIKEQPS